MFKEMVISIVIVISIVALDFVTQNYTEKSVQETTKMLSELKENIKNSGNNAGNSSENIMSRWKERKNKLAYFIEHDELEKVDTNLTNLKSYFEVGDTDMAINSIDEAEYLLEHIKRKNEFSLVNVF